MTIDVWMQHPTLRFLGQEAFESLRRWTGQELPREELPIDVTIAAMDQADVSFGLLSAWHSPAGVLIGNDETHGWVTEHPDRFAGVAAVNLSKPMQAVRELRRCVTELGFKGLRVVPWLWDAPPTDRRYYPLYALCVELGVPFFTQVGHTGPLQPSETGRPIPYIDQVALDFPELVIVGGHIGYPWTEEMIAVARKHENVYIDTSAYTAKRYPPELVRYTRTGSVVDRADTPALLLAPGGNLANGGADRPVGGARVLDRRCSGVAVAGWVGVTPCVPEPKPGESRTAVVRLLDSGGAALSRAPIPTIGLRPLRSYRPSGFRIVACRESGGGGDGAGRPSFAAV